MGALGKVKHIARKLRDPELPIKIAKRLWRIALAYKNILNKWYLLGLARFNKEHKMRVNSSIEAGLDLNWSFWDLENSPPPNLGEKFSIVLGCSGADEIELLFLINSTTNKQFQFEVFKKEGNHYYFLPQLSEGGVYFVGAQISRGGERDKAFAKGFIWLAPVYYQMEGFDRSEVLQGETIHASGALFVKGERVRSVEAEVINTESEYLFSQKLVYPGLRFDILEKFPFYEAGNSGFEGQIMLNSPGIYKARLKYHLYSGKKQVTRWIHQFAVNKKTILQPPYPKFTIITILYSKENEVPYFVESLFRQDYLGEIEILFIDDVTPDNSLGAVERAFEACREKYKVGDRISYRILRNTENMGNCFSRNRGLAEATGDILVIIDADCMFNKDFLYQHAEAYAYGDANAVIGSFNLETNGQDPLAFLEQCDHNLKKVLSESDLQDPINPTSFLNCITRNFSVSRKFLLENGITKLFDEDFSYSKDRKSGFGWEDVEMGYRLYQHAAKVKYIRTCFTVHITHPSSISEKEKPVKSLVNFAKLFNKHPELKHIGRRWAIDTYGKITKWSDKLRVDRIPERDFMDKELGYLKEAPYFVKNRNKLKILTYRWHCPHQFELYKLGHEIHLVGDLDTGFTREWNYEERPMPENARFVSWKETKKNNYDLAILHFDENVLSYENCNGVIGPDWGANFQFFMKNVDIPKVAICHGTPQFYGQYRAEVSPDKVMKVIEKARQKLVDYVGDMKIICNSYQAHKEWGFKNSRVIWQGFDPAEFPLTTYKKGILTMGKSMKERPHYRGHILYEKVINDLFPKEFMPDGPKVAPPSPLYDRYSNDYARAKYRNYIDNIRDYSVYFNPTLRSPMPRSRGEAMMCGLATVSANNHDVELFIKNGVNGFYSNDPDELREYLLFLMKNPSFAKQIGAEARRTSMDVFNHDRYLQSWVNTIKELTGK